MKGVFRFGKKGKVSSRYVGPFEIEKRVGEVAYKLVKVQWQHHSEKEAIWESEKDMKEQYPHLLEFGDQIPDGGENVTPQVS